MKSKRLAAFGLYFLLIFNGCLDSPTALPTSNPKISDLTENLHFEVNLDTDENEDTTMNMDRFIFVYKPTRNALPDSECTSEKSKIVTGP